MECIHAENICAKVRCAILNEGQRDLRFEMKISVHSKMRRKDRGEWNLQRLGGGEFLYSAFEYCGWMGAVLKFRIPFKNNDLLPSGARATKFSNLTRSCPLLLPGHTHPNAWKFKFTKIYYCSSPIFVLGS